MHPTNTLHHTSQYTLSPQVRRGSVKKRKGGGGSYRAFVHIHSKGKKGKANFKDLSVRYKAAQESGDPQLQNLVTLGRAATVAARGSSGSAFGMKSREVSRLSLKRAREAAFHRSRSVDHITRAKLVAKDSLLQQGHLENAISTARKMMRMDTQARHRAEQEQVDLLQRWVDVVGSEFMHGLASSVPGMAVENAQPVPTPRGPAVEICATTSATATSAAAWASHSHETNLATWLEKDWLQRHLTIPESSCTPLTPAAPHVQKGRCQDAGYCLCSPHGRELHRMRNSFLRIMKDTYVSKHEKAKLGLGEVVIRCTRSNPLSPSPSSATTLLDHARASDQVCQEIWLHVCAMYWSPYKPIFSKLIVTQCPASEEPSPDRIYLQAWNLVNEKCPHPLSRDHNTHQKQILSSLTKA